MSDAAPSNQQERSASFLREMAGWTSSQALLPEQEFLGQVGVLGQAFEAQCAEFVVDEPSRDIVAQVALVAATHQVLTACGVPAQTSLRAMVDALARWVRANAEAYSLARLGIDSNEPDQAFDRARENFKVRGEARFGKHFVYVQEVSDAQRSHVSIRRCLFNDLGRFLGQPEITPVFCAMDMIWAEHATRPPFNLQFERPSTLAAGADRCSFQFSRRV